MFVPSTVCISDLSTSTVASKLFELAQLPNSPIWYFFWIDVLSDVWHFCVTQMCTTELALLDREQNTIAEVDHDDPKAVEEIEPYDARTLLWHASRHDVDSVDLVEPPVVISPVLEVAPVARTIVPEPCTAGTDIACLVVTTGLSELSPVDVSPSRAFLRSLLCP